MYLVFSLCPYNKPSCNDRYYHFHLEKKRKRPREGLEAKPVTLSWFLPELHSTPPQLSAPRECGIQIATFYSALTSSYLHQ